MTDDKPIPSYLRDLEAMIRDPDAVLKIGSVQHFARQHGKSQLNAMVREYCRVKGIPCYTPAPGIQGTPASFIVEDELSLAEARYSTEPNPIDAWWRQRRPR